MAGINPRALAEVKVALERYEIQVKAYKLQPNSQNTYLLHARNFIRWLEGNFTPGGTL